MILGAITGDIIGSRYEAVSLGGDSDTIAAMTGSITEAFYGGVPQWIADEVIKRLPEGFIEVIKRFDDLVFNPLRG